MSLMSELEALIDSRIPAPLPPVPPPPDEVVHNFSDLRKKLDDPTVGTIELGNHAIGIPAVEILRPVRIYGGPNTKLVLESAEVAPGVVTVLAPYGGVVLHDFTISSNNNLKGSTANPYHSACLSVQTDRVLVSQVTARADNETYCGIQNFGSESVFTGCRSFDYRGKGFNQANRGSGYPLKSVAIYGMYCSATNDTDFSRGGVQIDPGSVPIDSVILDRVVVGPQTMQQNSQAGIKVAQASRVTISRCEANLEYNWMGIVLGEGLGTVDIEHSSVNGIIHYPGPEVGRDPMVNRVTVSSSRLQRIGNAHLYDCRGARQLRFQDTEFLGIERTGLTDRTPASEVQSRLFDNCRFTMSDAEPAPAYPQAVFTHGSLVYPDGTFKFTNNHLGPGVNKSSRPWLAALM